MARGYFKHLDVELLREYAKKWVKRFDYVMFEQIELRMFSHPHHLDDIARDQPEVVYAIIFKTLEPAEDPISRLSGDAKKLVEELGSSLATDNEAPKLSKKERQVLVDSIVGVIDEDHPSRITGGAPIRPFERLVAATEYYGTLWPKSYRALVGRDFKNIYNNEPPPGKDYLNEWIFIALQKGQALPLGVDNETDPVILYQAPVQKRRAKISEKDECQRIASEVWLKQPTLKIKYMKLHPGIRALTGKLFSKKTIHVWLSEVAPEDVKRPGRLSGKALRRQKALCEKLGIEWPH